MVMADRATRLLTEGRVPTMETAQALLSSLPQDCGKLTPMAPLARASWFRTGGPAEVLYEPGSEEELSQFLKSLDSSVPLMVLGVGSNTLVRDGGVPGVTIILGDGFSHIHCDGQAVTVGAGAMDVHVARAAAEAGVSGLEFLVGVPGTIGGALAMNAGAYGREMKDILVWAGAMDRQGRPYVLGLDDFNYAYRASALPKGMIFTRAVLGGKRGDPDKIQQAMDEISQARSSSQPIGSRTGGSTFKNPFEQSDLRAWELIDRAGCRGLKQGGAQISELHCNFIVCDKGTTAEDIEILGEEVRKRVKDSSGVLLEWEIKRVGLCSNGTIAADGKG